MSSKRYSGGLGAPLASLSFWALGSIQSEDDELLASVTLAVWEPTRQHPVISWRSCGTKMKPGLGTGTLTAVQSLPVPPKTVLRIFCGHVGTG